MTSLTSSLPVQSSVRDARRIICSGDRELTSLLCNRYYKTQWRFDFSKLGELKEARTRRR
mgnify:CR=1 FL=1